MIRTRLVHCLGLFALALLLTSTTAARAEGLLASTIKGTPDLGVIDALSFAEGGVLLIGDGRNAQIIAVQTGDTKPVEWKQTKLENLKEHLAGRLGVEGKDVEILDLAVNPASGRAYIAVRKQDDKRYLILTVDGSGPAQLFDLEGVTFARIQLPKGEQAPISKITDVAATDGRIVAAARANEEFASKIFSIATPVKHNASANIYSAETYHVSHRKWETKAPMSVILPFEEDGKQYVAGAFSCTPVVKYPLDAVQPGARIKGSSVLEVGSGNRPIDMILYEKEGKQYVLTNTFRFHHERRPFGPSPYWTVRFDRDVLFEDDEVNEEALRRLKGNDPGTDRVEMIEAYHGVSQLDRLGADRAVVIRTSADGRDDLEVLPLP